MFTVRYEVMFKKWLIIFGGSIYDVTQHPSNFS